MRIEHARRQVLQRAFPDGFVAMQAENDPADLSNGNPAAEAVHELAMNRAADSGETYLAARRTLTEKALGRFSLQQDQAPDVITTEVSDVGP